MGKNLIRVYAVHAVNGILGAVFVPFAVHYLGKAGYGIYGVYTTLIGYVALVDLGITKNLSRVLAGDADPEQRQKNLRTALGLYLAISGSIILFLPLFIQLVSLYLFPVDEASRSVVRWITALAFLEYILGIPAMMMQALCLADERFDQYSRYNFASNLLRYGLLFMATYFFQKPHLVVASAVARRLADVFLAKRMMGGLPSGSWIPRFEKKAFGLFIGQSALLSLSQWFQTTMIAIGSIFVNRVFGLEALGVYRASFDLANRIWFFSNGIGLVVFPRFVRMWSDAANRGRLAEKLPPLLAISWTGYALISVTGAILAPVILPVLGLESDAIINLFILLLVGVSMNAHANLSYEFLQAAGRYGKTAIMSFVAIILMAVSFYNSVDHGGLLAIGWAWLISQLVYAVIADGFTLHELKRRGEEQ